MTAEVSPFEGGLFAKELGRLRGVGLWVGLLEKWNEGRGHPSDSRVQL
jgi:hypothetical protein